MKDLAKNGNEEFKVLEHWKGISPEDRTAKSCNENELNDFFNSKWEKPII